MKIMIVGVGHLGSQVAFLSMMMLKPEKIILSDTKDLHGDILDLRHAAKGLNLRIEITEKRDGADFIIITAGKANNPSWLDEQGLFVYNKPVLEQMNLKDCLKRDTTIIMMTNPVHEITKLAKALWPDHRVLNPEEILLKMRDGKDYGAEIIKTKGYTSFGGAVSAVLLIEELVKGK